MSHPAGQTAQRCYRHPQREALVTCTRCDRPICPDCMRPASVGFHCPDDVASGRRSIRAQRTSVGAVLRNSPPYATAGLIAANIAVYVITGLQAPTGIGSPGNGVTTTSLFYKWQLVPILVHQDGSYWRLVTAMFLHVNLLHIGSNMLALFFVGPALERLIGPSRFLALYFLAGVGGSVAIYVFGSVDLAVVGASGAIFGVFGACLVLVRKLNLDLQYLVAVIVINFAVTFSVPDISRLGHIGGFVTGAVAAVAIGGWPTVRGRISTRVQTTGLSALGVTLVVIVVLRSALGTF